MKKYWELTKPWKWLLFSFLVFGFWLLGCSKKFFFGFSVWKKPRRFIWGSIYSCTMDGFFRIFKKAVSELICTRLYLRLQMPYSLILKYCPSTITQRTLLGCNTKYSTYKSGPQEGLEIWGTSGKVMGIICPNHWVRGIGRDIDIEYSKQFKWNSYFYVSGQNRPFWAALKLL